MNRVDRLMGVVTTLQSKKYVSAEFLSEKFNISVRTVYRDIKALAEIGIPVSFEANKGYFVVQGYFLAPVSFSSDEANALALMETLTDKFGDQSIKRHYETALNKVKAVLRESEKEKINHLHSQIRIYQHPDQEEGPYYLSIIQKAITDRSVLELHYQNKQAKASKREVEPIGLTYYGSDWHMIAWCWKREAYRDFKIQHIQKLVDTYCPFRKKDHQDLNEYIKSLL